MKRRRGGGNAGRRSAPKAAKPKDSIKDLPGKLVGPLPGRKPARVDLPDTVFARVTGRRPRYVRP